MYGHVERSLEILFPVDISISAHLSSNCMIRVLIAFSHVHTLRRCVRMYGHASCTKTECQSVFLLSREPYFLPKLIMICF